MKKKSQGDVIEVVDQEDKNKMVFNIPGQRFQWFDDYGLCHYISEAMNEYRFELLHDD